ncbi:MAG TPA: limonene-1,2-epoxide hydrolase family protein [Jatrophihabitans sp.]|jgi:limonene-1,2-epoxide hydrolase|nr:limonene-1,2-epoxide hydrolase family protein [Jatrophihabitans sp.]
MVTSFTPRLLHDAAAPPSAPQAVVEAFLAALTVPEVGTALDLLDERVTYTNVGLPTIHGRRRVTRVLTGLERPGVGFEVYLHAIATDGPVVLTERTDALRLGSVRLQFWVTGRFDVHDGKITLWRDSFDYLDVARSLARGIVGAAIPALRPKAPSSADVAPGRH